MARDAVIFEDSQGNIITNDPLYRAQQILKEAEENQPAGTQAANLVPAPEPSLDEEVEQSGTNEDGDRYDEMNGTDLKAEAKERGVDISGLTKVSQVRSALRDADAGK